jgi:hypothetical protein
MPRRQQPDVGARKLNNWRSKRRVEEVSEPSVISSDRCMTLVVNGGVLAAATVDGQRGSDQRCGRGG